MCFKRDLAFDTAWDLKTLRNEYMNTPQQFYKVNRDEVLLATNWSEGKQQTEKASHMIYIQILIATCVAIQYKVDFAVVWDLKTFELNK